MNDQTDTGLSGQQLQSIRASAEQAMRIALERINLRQKCLEMAIQVCGNQPDKVVAIAREMYEFAAFPATSVKILTPNE